MHVTTSAEFLSARKNSRKSEGVTPPQRPDCGTRDRMFSFLAAGFNRGAGFTRALKPPRPPYRNSIPARADIPAALPPISLCTNRGLLYFVFSLATSNSCESAVRFKPYPIQIATIAAQRQRLCGPQKRLTRIKTDTGRCGYACRARPGSGYSRAVRATSRSDGWRMPNCGNGKRNSTPRWNPWPRRRPDATA
jgi:hypothetical protein